MDLGECPKIHDLALRADYELASKTKDYFYDIDVSILLFKWKFCYILRQTLIVVELYLFILASQQ